MKKKIEEALLLLIVLAIAPTFGAAPGIELSIEEEWNGVFGGEDAVFHVGASADREFSGRLTWRLSKNGRTIHRGESSIHVRPQAAETAAIVLPVPPVNPGASLDLTLSVAAAGEEAQRASARTEKTVHVFSKEPFYGRKQWLADLKIHLFDPDGRTAGIFEEAKVEFKAVHNPEALRDVENGLVIVGEGISFEDHRGVPEIMLELAGGGAPVLCLAPAGGEFALPESDAEVSLQSLTLRRADVIADLNKRLDSAAWPPDGRISAAGLALKGRRGVVTAEVERGSAAWPWLDMTFGSGGRLIVCGFAVMEKWDTGPVPRFLLAEMLTLLE